MLNKEESTRYARHIALKEIGEEGQIKLKNAKVLIVGVGGLGSPLALYLSAAGVGTIGLIDDDVVSVSNLQRQILYNSHEVGKSKVLVAKEKLKALNPFVNIISHNKRLTEENSINIIQDYDIIVDGCDNLLTRYTINEACLHINIPYIYGSIAEFTGQVAVFNHNNSKSYKDLFPLCDEISSIKQPKGVVGVLPGIIASLQANETLKVICGYGEVLSDKLLLFDALKNTYNILTI